MRGFLFCARMKNASTEILYDIFLKSAGVSTDTRSIIPGSIFFALKGDRFNGNKFAQQALHNGAAFAVIDEEEFYSPVKMILVGDALVALQQLANFHRRRFSIPVLAITGSNGKTTTKELITAVLSKKFRVHATRGNFNNHIGVPLTLLSMPRETEYAVIELGANHAGEIKLLCDITEPTIGIITNNGKDHLEGFGSVEGVRKANGELFDFLRNRSAAKIFVSNLQEDLMRSSEGISRFTYGNAPADYSGKIIPGNNFLKMEFLAGEKFYPVHTNLVGDYNFENLICAVAVGMQTGVSADKIVEAVESYAPSNNRSQLTKLGGWDIILDCYNANPSSMLLSLQSFSKMKHNKKIAVLGDMLEMGSESFSEHKKMLEEAGKLPIDEIICIGPEFEKAIQAIPAAGSIKHFPSSESARPWFVSMQHQSGGMLLKGSRGIGLEKIIQDSILQKSESK